MSETKFEGDLQHISERQLQFITNVLKEKGFDGAIVTIKPVGKAGDNYSSNIKRIVANKNDEEFRMIAKIAHNIELMRQTVNMHAIFQNESTIYTDVLPVFTEIEKQAGVPESERLRYANCYGTLMEAPHEVILLEDLQIHGYEMLDRFKSFTDHNIKIVLNNFAKLHSLSFALRHQNPEKFTEMKRKMVNLWEVFGSEAMKMFFVHVEISVMALLDKQEHKNAIRGLVSEAPTMMTELHKDDSESRFSVIQQGDSWINNLMFIMEGDKTVECCMVDYQQSRINSPVADLLYMLFNCTDYEIRKVHFLDWISYYHSQLDKCLSRYGLKAAQVYPRDQLDADIKRHGRSSMCLSVLLAAVLMRDSGDAAKLQEMMEKGVPFEKMLEAMGPEAMELSSMVRYKVRLEGLIDSHLELGLL
ncbi:ecdysteroid kinase domain-containing protein [Phthorimaea operculella]|nr:ecdysteroid kinase domain-containing protein [Phthorimaea operculella]